MSFALAGVAVVLSRHAGVLVGEVEEAPGEFDSDGLVTIEREEPNAGAARFVVDVGADVEFEKVGKPRDAGEEARTDFLHKEGDEAEVALAIVQVDGEAIGNAGLDFGGVDFPMEKEEVAPGLKHDRGSGWFFADGEAVLEGGGFH